MGKGSDGDLPAVYAAISGMEYFRVKCLVIVEEFFQHEIHLVFTLIVDLTGKNEVVQTSNLYKYIFSSAFSTLRDAFCISTGTLHRPTTLLWYGAIRLQSRCRTDW